MPAIRYGDFDKNNGMSKIGAQGSVSDYRKRLEEEEEKKRKKKQKFSKNVLAARLAR